MLPFDKPIHYLAKRGVAQVTKVGDAAHKSFLVFPISAGLEDLLKELKRTKCTYVLATLNGKVKKIIHISALWQEIINKGRLLTWENITSSGRFVILKYTDPIEDLLTLEDNVELVLVQDQEKKPIGIIDNLIGIKSLIRRFSDTVPGDPLPLVESCERVG